MFLLPRNKISGSFKSKQPELDARAVLEVHRTRCLICYSHCSVFPLYLKAFFFGGSRKNNEVRYV